MQKELRTDFYNRAKETPDVAKKAITGGKLNNFTSIVPQYRFQVLTEEYGPCGEGWGIEPMGSRIERCSELAESVIVVDLQLWYISNISGKLCTIPGTGTAFFTKMEKGKLVMDDEAFKKAGTDALSVCCKYLGIGADVYWSDGSKYDTLMGDESDVSKPAAKGKAPEAEKPKGKMLKTDEIVSESRALGMVDYINANDMSVGDICKELGVEALTELTNGQATELGANLKKAVDEKAAAAKKEATGDGK